MDDTINYWLALIRIPGLGPSGQRKLLNEFQIPERIFQLDRKTLNQYGLAEKSIKYILQPDWKEIEVDINWLEKENNNLITSNNILYPPLLKQIYNAPVILFTAGNKDILKLSQFAIVGSRNPSTFGKRIARDYGKNISELGLTITSGLALGIDAEAHQGALDVNNFTIAVLGNGLDMIYPKRHGKLAERIIEKGLLVSEFPPGVKPLATNFPRRNRIISGMSTGVLVVEAAIQSGSLITARFAMEQNREVFAIPGSINNPLSKGPHKLIKEGAKLTENIHDIIEELDSLVHANLQLNTNIDETNSPSFNPGVNKQYNILLEIMSSGPASIDNLVQQTALTAGEVSSMLLILELKGLVSSDPGGLYSRLI